MDFKDAKDLSLQNPGSVITRDGDGEFIVRMPNGRVIKMQKEEGPEGTLEDLHRKLDFEKDRNIQLNCQLKKEKGKRQALEVELEQLREQHKKLEKRVAKDTGESNDNKDVPSTELEHDRVLALVESGGLSSAQIQQLLDQADRFKFTSEERDCLLNKIYEARRDEARRFNPDSFVIHAKTDGQ